MSKENKFFFRCKRIIKAGLIKENPTFRLVLGMCPTLAVTTKVENSLGMGLATTAVLIFTNLIISALRKVIPDKVRIPVYITIIAGMVTIVQLLLKAFLPDIDKALGVFIPLITVNCIILARAEMFANKNTPFYSALDGVAMGIGFTVALTLIGSVREIVAQGTWLNIAILPEAFPKTAIIGLPAGAFLVLGLLMAGVNKLTGGHKAEPENKCMGCTLCAQGAKRCAEAAPETEEVKA